MKKLCVVCIMVIGVLAANMAMAKEFSYPAEAPVFAITFPDDWNVETDEQMLNALPADESLYLGVWALHDLNDLSSAAELVDELIVDLVSDVTFEEGEEIDVNGVTFWIIDGQGTDAETGEPVNVGVALFTPNGEIVFMLVYYGLPEADQAHEKELDAIIQSIKVAQ